MSTLQYQPIETCPKDNTPFYAWRPRTKSWIKVRYEGYEGFENLVLDPEGGKVWVSDYWMPYDALPNPEEDN